MPARAARFDAFLGSLNRRPKAIITDSQAMDLMHTWTPDDMMLTTFSIMMVNYGSRGRLAAFCQGDQSPRYTQGRRQGSDR